MKYKLGAMDNPKCGFLSQNEISILIALHSIVIGNKFFRNERLKFESSLDKICKRAIFCDYANKEMQFIN